MTDQVDESRAPIALLDANVLAQLTAREALFAFADAGDVRLRWSPRIEAEWARVAAKPGRELEAATISGDQALARLKLPDACTVTEAEVAARDADLSLPDWHDRHVLAAALLTSADLIVTDNLRDFPRRTLAGFGLAAQSADAFLAERAGLADARLVREVALALNGPGETLPLEALPKRLKGARLPRFAKALGRRLS